MAAQFAKSCLDAHRRSAVLRHRQQRARHGRAARRVGAAEDGLSRLLLRHGARLGVRPHVPDSRRRDGARRRGRPADVRRRTVNVPAVRLRAGVRPVRGVLPQDRAVQRVWATRPRPPRTSRTPRLSQPLPTSTSRKLTANLASTGIQEAMYSRELWSKLGTALVHAKGGDGTDLLALADEYNRRSDKGQYSNLIDAFNTIGCNDADPGPTNEQIRATAAQWAGAVPDLRQVVRRRAVHLPVLAAAPDGAPEADRAHAPGGAGDRQHPRPGDAVPGRARPGQDHGQRRGAVVGRAGAHVLSQRQHLRRSST